MEGEGNPYQDMEETLDLIYSDSQINNYETMVPGNDLCDILGLFFDLAGSMELKQKKDIEVLEKYKVAYNNKVRREKKAKEKGGIENDEAVKSMREENNRLHKEKEEALKELERQKEDLDILLIDNDEKDQKIKDLINELKIKQTQAETLLQGLSTATEEQNQINSLYKDMNLKLKAVEVEKELSNKRLKVIRTEKEQKEKEAADHLEEIETKAARVDELEK